MWNGRVLLSLQEKKLIIDICKGLGRLDRVVVRMTFPLDEKCLETGFITLRILSFSSEMIYFYTGGSHGGLVTWYIKDKDQ